MASNQDQDALQSLETIRSFLRAREFQDADYRDAMKASKDLHDYAGKRAQSSKAMDAINREGLEGLDRKIEEARKQQQSGALNQTEPEEE